MVDKTARILAEAAVVVVVVRRTDPEAVRNLVGEAALLHNTDSGDNRQLVRDSRLLGQGKDFVAVVGEDIGLPEDKGWLDRDSPEVGDIVPAEEGIAVVVVGRSRDTHPTGRNKGMT